MSLTIKQENFCLAYIETGNASEAYRRSFSAGKMKPETINVKASELLSLGKVAVRIAELRKPVVEAAQITLEQHLNDLKELRDKASQDAKWGPAINAEVARGKAAGLYVEKVIGAGENGEHLFKNTAAAPALSREEWLIAHGVTMPEVK